MKWESISNDDFKLTEGDYTLRVEQMDTDNWWWEVYYKGDSILGHCHYHPDTEEMAKAMAEMVYLAHKQALRKIQDFLN